MANKNLRPGMILKFIPNKDWKIPYSIYLISYSKKCEIPSRKIDPNGFYCMECSKEVWKAMVITPEGSRSGGFLSIGEYCAGCNLHFTIEENNEKQIG